MFSDGSVIVSSHAIKLVKESRKNFFSSLGAVDELGALRHVVNCVDVFNTDSSVVAAINQSKGLLDHVLSTLSKRISESTDELLVSDIAITIDIVILHESLNLDDLGENAEGRKSLSELLLVELLVSVVVHLTEDNTDGAEANATLLLDLHLELVVDAANFDVEADAVKL